MKDIWKANYEELTGKKLGQVSSEELQRFAEEQRKKQMEEFEKNYNKQERA